jgi:hypothetical protein
LQTPAQHRSANEFSILQYVHALRRKSVHTNPSMIAVRN